VTSPVVVVTGGAGGLGEATGRLFAENGWRVALTDVDLDKADAVAKTFPGPTLTARCDVSNRREVDASIGEIESAWGQLDCVVNNAGIAKPSPSHLVSDEDWHELIEAHLGGTFRMSRAALRLLARSEQPAIVNISSVCAARGFPGRLSYNAAKAGIEAVTRTLAVEWGVLGIRVNAVAPGFILTEKSRTFYESGLADAESRASRTALGRLGRPEEIAEAAYWLGSMGSSYVTGHVLVVDGGYLADGRTGPDPAVLDAASLIATVPD
jgi:NAD(P)-dependent dehydrogenase (short-subunit alcohol dehydrogenase family)